MTFLQMMLRLTFLSSLYILQVVANQFSPHLFPQAGPYFEGWYMRLLDVQSGRSIGLLFGHVLPDTTNLTVPVVAVSILYSEGCTTCKLMSYNGFFNRSQVCLYVWWVILFGNMLNPNYHFKVLCPALLNIKCECTYASLWLIIEVWGNDGHKLKNNSVFGPCFSTKYRN